MGVLPFGPPRPRPQPKPRPKSDSPPFPQPGERHPEYPGMFLQNVETESIDTSDLDGPKRLAGLSEMTLTYVGSPVDTKPAPAPPPANETKTKGARLHTLQVPGNMSDDEMKQTQDDWNRSGWFGKSGVKLVRGASRPSVVERCESSWGETLPMRRLRRLRAQVIRTATWKVAAIICWAAFWAVYASVV